MEDTALIFVLNRKYVRPLKVLLYSLHVNQSLMGCPIVVVTDDESVVADPFVRSVAHSIEYMTSEALAPFSAIKGDRIAEKSRVHFAPKYTFLKFTIFKNRGFKRHIFMDADMLCLNALDEQLLGEGGFSVKAMKEIPSSLFPIRDEVRPKFNYGKSLAAISRAFEPQENTPGTGINSGFVVLEGAAISDEIFETALRTASSEAFGAEQPATSAVIGKIPACRFLELPFWYNTRRRVLECFGEEFFLNHKRDVKILHYTPGKPWILGDRTPDYLDNLWLAWEKESLAWVAERTARAA
jgi:lipopolysaccharide biosynthesis glycosyltransferase